MGLDISVYTHVTPLPETGAWDEEPDWDAGVRRIYQNACFITRGAGVELPKAQPGRDGSSDFHFGDFSVSEGPSFHAGSYSGYNRWREQLASLVGADLDGLWADGGTDVPFGELLNFTDCEGFLGPEVCHRLMRDFQDHHSAAQVHFDEYGLEKYEAWMRGVELAAKNSGVVVFH